MCGADGRPDSPAGAPRPARNDAITQRFAALDSRELRHARVHDRSSLATLQIPAMGYGLRYEYGLFRQDMVNGWQRETPDNWLRRQDPWEIARLNDAASGHFSSDRAIAQYAADIWDVAPCPVPQKPSGVNRGASR
jgi:hypothetical protein